jgi:hypothetical protein
MVNPFSGNNNLINRFSNQGGHGIPPGSRLEAFNRHAASMGINDKTCVYTYFRTECQRCHLGVRGRDKRGDMCGMGCAACHIPYSNEGFYEGTDHAIPQDKKGHPLVHSIQSSREAKVVANGKVYSDIPHETCVICHNHGKRIGVSFQGLMELPLGEIKAGPFGLGFFITVTHFAVVMSS